MNATEVIAMAEPPVALSAVRRFLHCKGLYMVREGKRDAFVSAGARAQCWQADRLSWAEREWSVLRSRL
ncbi:MAG: hypothetical protein ACLUOI_09105 [Eisenbergiella sp.]